MLRFQFKPRHPITRVAFTLDGSVVTAQPFTGIAVRDRLTGEARMTVPTPRRSRFSGLAVHPTLGWVAWYDLNDSALLDPVAGVMLSNIVQTATGTPARPELLNRFQMWWRGGERVSVTWGGVGRPTAHLRDGGKRANLSGTYRPFRGLNPPHVVAFAPDGTKLAIGTGETLGVFDLAPLETATKEKPIILDPLFTLDRPDPTRHGTYADRTAEHWLPPVAFDHTGRSLFTLGLRNRVQRIDLATGGVMAEWGWRCEPIRSLAVAPDDLTAAAGCQRGELVVWDLE